MELGKRMKNMTTKSFINRFSVSFKDIDFLKKYRTMQECYDALLDNAHGEDSLPLAITIFSNAVPIYLTRSFCLWCVKRCQKYMKRESSLNAIKIMEQYLKKEIELSELIEYGKKISRQSYDVNEDVAVEMLNEDHKDAIEYVSFGSLNVNKDEQEYKIQLEKLKQIGNPFV